MKLTNREKILLPLALLIIAGALFINFVYLPMDKEIKTFKEQVRENEYQINDTEVKKSAIKDLQDQLTQAQKNFESEHMDIMQAWDQPELIVFVENTINSLCEKQSIDFFDAVSAQAVQAGEINIVFNTDYDSFKAIMKKFEDAKYYNTITLFDIKEPDDTNEKTKDGKKLLNVTMNIRFYAKNINNVYPLDYSFMDGAYGKSNLFQ